ncbi:hypothetical protein EYF80_024452 [Liparis tanakae]|uniref:Uncharacterized protein n=1 Tax=Liparis tanakae TaxID=230148 RepID=A0A4Z2HHH0_9TELE|nr:hypothetical protein EYF80_024452 [Liparis tanakae]
MATSNLFNLESAHFAHVAVAHFPVAGGTLTVVAALCVLTHLRTGAVRLTLIDVLSRSTSYPGLQEQMKPVPFRLVHWCWHSFSSQLSLWSHTYGSATQRPLVHLNWSSVQGGSVGSRPEGHAHKDTALLKEQSTNNQDELNGWWKCNECWSLTEFLLLVAAVSTVVFLVAQHAGVDAVAVGTAEPGRHLTGPGNRSGRHTAARQGRSDPSHTGTNPDDTSAALEERQAVRSDVRDRGYFEGTSRRAPPAHHSLARPSYPRSRYHGHTPSSRGCTERRHIETHSRSRASALWTTMHRRKRRNQKKVLLGMHTRHRSSEPSHRQRMATQRWLSHRKSPRGSQVNSSVGGQSEMDR